MVTAITVSNHSQGHDPEDLFFDVNSSFYDDENRS